METNAIQANANSAVDQTTRARQQSETQRLDQLILGGPGLIDPAQSVNAPDDDGLRPEDRFEPLNTDAALLAKPAQAVKAPEVGAPVARAEEDFVVSLNGRGGAVALQNHLTDLLKSGQNQQFKATAEALGVEDTEEFQRLVERGVALQTFGAIDSNRVVFTDGNFNEISADQVSAVAKAQLVIKPSYAVPIDPEVEAPEVNLLDPNRRQQKDLDLPEDPTEQLQDKLTQPHQVNETVTIAV